MWLSNWNVHTILYYCTIQAFSLTCYFGCLDKRCSTAFDLYGVGIINTTVFCSGELCFGSGSERTFFIIVPRMGTCWGCAVKGEMHSLLKLSVRCWEKSRPQVSKGIANIMCRIGIIIPCVFLLLRLISTHALSHIKKNFWNFFRNAYFVLFAAFKINKLSPSLFVDLGGPV